MTRGTVVVLGPVGRNFGAGMSNGAAYVLDDDDSLSSLCNPDMVAVTDLEESDETVLRQLLSEHAGLTGSPKARAILEDWPAQRARFRKVAPPAPPAPPQSPAAEAAPAASDAPEEASDQGAVAQP
jgi:glutamate synthase domain-containing protein 3